MLSSCLMVVMLFTWRIDNWLGAVHAAAPCILKVVEVRHGTTTCFTGGESCG